MTEKQKFNAAILTPYLYADLKDLNDWGLTGTDIREQKEKYGYDQDNFSNTKVLETEKHQVILNTKKDHNDEQPDLVIIGSTRATENQARELRDSGIVVARYSIFYGGPSGYTGRSPEQSGYSLDLPKSVATATALLTHEGTLDAILERDEAKVMAALEDLNKNLSQPVLATPFLKIALGIER